jgi:asparagine synthase (glutamine-hydrolysing)
LKGVDPELLQAMTHRVAHRGPDGFGFAYAFLDETSRPEVIHNENRPPRCPRPVVGLGNRRLAIFDLSDRGNQPMQIADGAYSVTYNGEIYNHREIRVELERKGHLFRTCSDTEVLLKAYQEWGSECLLRFNGMWSFAIWDQRKQTLFCARDRFGVKPLYYALWNSTFFFASEIKQIVHLPGWSRRANARSAFVFLEQGIFDHSADTFFEGVFQLPAGHSLTLKVVDPFAPVMRQYWELSLQPRELRKEHEACEEFSERFSRAVALRLRSDVPVGYSLSGGLDSSSIVCQVRKMAVERSLPTFSACFDEPAIDEREFIRAVVSATGAESHLAFPSREGLWREIETILYHHDEPIAGSGVFAQWCVMREAREKSVPVLLGGQGGDEVFCGYQKYRYFYLWELLKKGDARLLSEVVQGMRNGTRNRWDLGELARYLPGPFPGRYSLARRIGSAETRQMLSSDPFHLGPRATLAERQKDDLTMASLPALLHYEDRNSMAHSIETRLPFLDYELVEFAINCPSFLKIRQGWSKWLLRQALAGILPDAVRARKTKLGFATPERNWLQTGLRDPERELWSPRSFRMARFMSAPDMTRETDKFLRAEMGALPASSLFRCVSLELWARVHGVN